MSVIQGSVILESLRVGTRLSGLKLQVREIYRFRQENVGSGQPDTWSVLEWEADEADAAEVAQAFSEVLDQPGWYVDFRSGQETFVVFPGRVFRYPRRDAARRAAAQAHARTLRRRLIDALLAEGFSQADLARELGVTRQAIQKMVAAGQDGPRR